MNDNMDAVLDTGNEPIDAGGVEQVDSNKSPQVYDVTDDSLVRVGGAKEPIRFGDLSRRQQADYTRKMQDLARQRQEFQSERARAEETLKGLAKELLARRQGQGQPGAQPDLLSQLEQKQWVDGKTAAALFREIQDKGLGRVSQAIEERDKIITALYQQVVNLSRNFQNINSTYSQQSFDQKIDRWVSELGLPQKAKQFAKVLYLAHEGDDLDDEFPTILREAWDEQVAVLREMDRERVDSARRSPFKLPGKGGQGVAGKPAGLTGRESAKETADILWEAIQGGSDKT